MKRELGISRLNPGGMPVPAGSYSQVVRAGEWAFISGQVALDRTGRLVGGSNVVAQCGQAIDNLEAALAAVGCRLDSVVKVVVYVVGREHLDAVRDVRRERFEAIPPASSMLLVTGLADERLLVEIEAIAYVPTSNDRPRNTD